MTVKSHKSLDALTSKLTDARCDEANAEKQYREARNVREALEAEYKLELEERLAVFVIGEHGLDIKADRFSIKTPEISEPLFKVDDGRVVIRPSVIGGFGLGEQGEDIKVEGTRGETIKTPSTPTDAYDQLQMVVELEARISSVLTLMKGYRHNWQHTDGYVVQTVNGKSIAKMTRQIENILTGKPLQS